MTRVLHLGCGQQKASGAIGVDLNPSSRADVVCDLNLFPYPVAKDVFDTVICEHILEHLDDLILVMEELHRISKSAARIRIQVPYFGSHVFYSDPTHTTFFSLHTFDYFLRGHPLREFGYSDAEFRILRVTFPPPPGAGILKRFLFQLFNRHQDFYEKHLAFILPRHSLDFELAVVK